jgi:hypothetical protein
MARLKSSNIQKRPKGSEERENIRRTASAVRPTYSRPQRRRRPGEFFFSAMKIRGLFDVVSRERTERFAWSFLLIELR